MNTDDLKKIAEDVRANHTALKECEGPHDFQPIDVKNVLGRKYRCTKCKGVVDAVAFAWYTDGLAHGAEEGRTLA